MFEEQPSSLIYPEGLTEGKITLSCQARANPPATYSWKLNGTLLELGSSRYTLVAGSLVISNPDSIQDTGSYQCLAKNPCGTIISRAANVKFGYLHDFPPNSRTSQTVYEGAGTVHACQPPPHYPALSYRWYFNEFPNFIRKDDGRWFVSQVTGNLYLAKAELNDTGNYFCFTTINLDISTKSTFSKGSLLTCLFISLLFSSPVPKLRWRKVDGLMPSKAGSSSESPTLTLPELSFDDEGIYECEAYNSEGKDTYQGRIVVQAQPEWLQVMSDSEVEISSELHWTCLAAGKPRPTVRWIRNGLFLSTQFPWLVLGWSLGGHWLVLGWSLAGPWLVVGWSLGGHWLVLGWSLAVTPDGTLWIYNISRADEGKYTCFAENYLGKANSTGHLSVRDATKITLAPSNADVNQGENVTLQCHASHDPTMDLTFTWALNGMPLDLEKSAGLYQRKENIGDLLIVNAQLSQAGIFTCTAQTVVDSASSSAKLVVRGPPGPPGGLLVKNVAETSVELKWSRGHDNHSPIGRYIIMGRSSLSSEWKKMMTEPANIEGNAESARVSGLIPWMDYEFQVIASNILGSGEPSMPSHVIRTKQAAPTVAPSGLGGGGGNPHELIVTWTVSGSLLYFMFFQFNILSFSAMLCKWM
uniref:Contactin 2 n=1 Tax=Cyprinodon variegatus TaxID=28743 RepID=A0A3Q2DBY3_CYPVA